VDSATLDPAVRTAEKADHAADRSGIRRFGLRNAMIVIAGLALAFEMGGHLLTLGAVCLVRVWDTAAHL
jgi:hypothetical protein